MAMLFMVKKPEKLDDLCTHDEIKLFLDKFAEAGIIAGYEEVSTVGYDLTADSKDRNTNRDRSNWADKIVKQLSGRERADIGRIDAFDEYDFSYIKLCRQVGTGNVYGLVHGKSMFHYKNPSDVEFYDLNNPPKSKKDSGLYDFCKNNNLEWYTDAIFIVKNKDCRDPLEAYSNERMLARAFHTFD